MNPGLAQILTIVHSADVADIELDEVVFECELGACTKDVDLGWYHLPQGSVGASAFSYVGRVGGVPRVELRLEWQMTPHTEPRWDIQGCYITKIDGDPVIYSKHMILPKPGTGSSPVASLSPSGTFSSVDSFAAIGMSVTGMPAVNAIRAVVDAAPGIITSADLPLRAFAGNFASR
jgi:4-hydroxy-tetrahydrodipicolinate reductase